MIAVGAISCGEVVPGDSDGTMPADASDMSGIDAGVTDGGIGGGRDSGAVIDGGLITDSGQPDGAFVDIDAGPDKGPLIALSQSSDLDTVDRAIDLRCKDADGFNLETHLMRVFDLPSEGVTGPFEIESVQFGIIDANAASGSQVMSVAFLLIDGDVSISNTEVIASYGLTITDRQLRWITSFPDPDAEAIVVPPNSKLGVVLFTPNAAGAQDRLVLAFNNEGQRAPGYYYAPDCGVIDYRDTEAEIAGAHLLMQVSGYELLAP